MHNYGVPTEAVRLALALGVILSTLVYERWRLTGGAVVVAGYLGLFIDRPLYIVTTVALAIGTYFIVQRFIAHKMFLYGRRRLVVMVLTGMTLQFLTGFIAFSTNQDAAWLSGLYGVGFVLPGLIAQDIERQGIRSTLLTALGTALLTFLLLHSLLAVKVYLPVSWNSIAFEDKTIVYSYHTQWLIPAVIASVVVSAFLFEQLGIRSGGFLTAAYMALFVLQPLHLVFIGGVGVLVFFFVTRVLMRKTPVFGRTKFAMMVLTGLAFTMALEVLVANVTRNAFVPFAGFSVISPMIAALIANDSERQGLRRTLSGVGAATLIVFVAIKGVDLLLTPTSVPLPLARPPSTSTPLRSITGDLWNQIARLEEDMPRAGSEGFVVPTDDEKATFAELVTRIEARDVDRAGRIAAENGYELMWYTDRGDAGPANLLLRELKPIRRGWGLYLFRSGPLRDVIVEAPHPISDEESSFIAMRAYRALHARALLIAGAHRNANRDGSADVAHQFQTIFEAIHEALPKSNSTIILQIHGFSSSKHPGYPQVVLGDEDATAADLLNRLSAALEAEGVRVGVCGSGAWRDLCGETNVQSRRVGAAPFIHIELDESIRANVDALLAALEQTLQASEVDSLLARARLHALKDEPASALADLTKALRLDPTHTEARLLRARMYAEQSQTDRALADLNAVLAMTPDDVALVELRAEWLSQLGDTAGAQADLERAVALRPGDATIVLRLGALLEEQGKLDEALTLYRTAAPTSHAPDRLYMHAGKIRYDLGHYWRALANFEAALKTKPENGDAYRGIGLAWRELGNTHMALVAFRSYLRLAPDAPDRAEIEAWMRKHSE